jgi:hypothetical protein
MALDVQARMYRMLICSTVLRIIQLTLFNQGVYPFFRLIKVYILVITIVSTGTHVDLSSTIVFQNDVSDDGFLPRQQ